MPKNLIAIPEGNLMSVAATKSVTTLTDLKEKTGVDRKTLRLINSGRPVKETTLQNIAKKLRVPLPHLLGPNAVDNVSTVAADGFLELKLQQLDATALRRIAGETNEINWFLKIDQMSLDLEVLLLKLRKSLHGWFAHEVGMTSDPEARDNLAEQIDYIKTSVNIDETVETLARRNLKIFGTTYVAWQKECLRDPDDDYHPISPVLTYTSRLVAALSIAPEQKINSSVRVHPGWEPPQQFVGSDIADGINFIEVDGKPVWSRESDSKFGLVDGGGITF